MKIQFTIEEKNQLQELFLELGFSGVVLQGKFGANSYNVYQLLHNTTLETLQGLFIQTKKEVEALGEVNRWTAGANQKAKINNLTKWKEYIYLLIGYKQFIAEEESERIANRRAAQAKLATLTKAKEAGEIDRISKLSPEDLEKEIAAAVAAL